MNILGMGGFFGPAPLTAKKPAAQNLPAGLTEITGPAVKSAASAPASETKTLTQDIPGTSAKDTFLEYMKKSTAEKIRESWLQQHGLSEEKLAAMDPKQRAAIEEQIRQEIEDQIKRQTEKKLGQNLNILA
jgi:predicted flavoprotein YhiN